MDNDFRFVLKAGTQRQHDSVDALFSSFDLHQYEGYARFLSLHAWCFTQLLAQADEPCLTHILLADMCAALEQDLTSLGHPRAAARLGDVGLSGPMDPLAIDYVVAGSRLGSQILKQRWADARDQSVRRAGMYLGLRHDPALWRAVCARLSQIKPDSPRALRVMDDVCAIFDLFAVSGRAGQTDTETGVLAR